MSNHFKVSLLLLVAAVALIFWAMAAFDPREKLMPNGRPAVTASSPQASKSTQGEALKLASEPVNARRQSNLSDAERKALAHANRELAKEVIAKLPRPQKILGYSSVDMVQFLRQSLPREINLSDEALGRVVIDAKEHVEADRRVYATATVARTKEIAKELDAQGRYKEEPQANEHGVIERKRSDNRESGDLNVFVLNMPDGSSREYEIRQSEFPEHFAARETVLVEIAHKYLERILAGIAEN